MAYIYKNDDKNEDRCEKRFRFFLRDIYLLHSLLMYITMNEKVED